MDRIQSSSVQVADAQRGFMARVHGWMGAALALTGFIAMLVVNSKGMMQLMFTPKGPSLLFYGLLIGELVLVVGLSAAIGRLSAMTAAMGLLLYAALNGVTLSVIFLAFTAESIATTFFVTAGTFGLVSVYGATTKADLTSIGSFCMMGLIGVILASVVNIFLKSSGLYWITTYVGIFVFIGLTAYDTAKLKAISMSVGTDQELGKKMSVMGALTLYLDFINMFLLLLRVFGKQR
jgi:FtsH-binding integral membrane protein